MIIRRSIFGGLVGVFFVCSLLFVPIQADAAIGFELPKCDRQVGDKPCQLGDAVNTLINVAEFIFGIVGSLTLLMFMYGGFVWVTSGGVESRITEGKSIVRNAIFGLVVVFLSAAVIQFALKALDVDDQFNLLNGKAGQVIKQ